MEEQQLVNIIEAALLAAGRPLALEELESLFPEDGCPERTELRAALDTLAQTCAERGVELREVSSGFRFQVKSDYAPWVSKLWEERPARYSRALLETLALIAYRQPITRAEIEEVRGVSVSSNIVKTLLERGWVRIVGHRDVPGRPALLATTREFLDYFNLKGLNDLPTLAEIRDLDSINAELDLVFPDAAENVQDPELAAIGDSEVVHEATPSVEPTDPAAQDTVSGTDVAAAQGDVAQATESSDGEAGNAPRLSAES
ncbi:MAG: SMC-Scp complex subunit ScpB [Pseudomonadota bacterium]|nr:MAG: SMC-Scp complex subunit ScpB [Pseudomonadota bacterium]